MTTKLNDLTENVLFEIYDFLTNQEKWQMFMSSKLIKEELHRHHILHLNKHYSHQYHDDSSFRDIVQRSYEEKQLGLSLYGDINPDLSQIARIHTLTITYCSELIDVSVLSTVYSLTFILCRITNISALSKVHTLRFYHCSGVSDISALRALSDVQKLTIYRCANIPNICRQFGCLVNSID